MAKRFTDTELWDKEWFMALPCRLKCLVKFVRDKCDISGVWSPNWAIATAYIGERVTEAELLQIDEGKQFKRLPNGRIFCMGFIKFQYVKLSLESRVHVRVIELASGHGIFDGIQSFIVNKSDTIQAKRSRITDKIRRKIYSEDEYNCQYCGGHFSFNELCLDHIFPLSKGGDNEDENLTTSCLTCNAKKWEHDVFEFIDSNEITPLDSLSKKLHTLSKKLHSPKEKDKDQDKEEEQDKEKVKDSAEATDTKVYTTPITLPAKQMTANSTDERLLEAEHWTDQVIANNDAVFINLLRNKGVAPGEHLIALARDHLETAVRYGWQKEWETQTTFRYSLLKHIKEGLTKIKNGQRNTTKTTIGQTSPEPGKRYNDEGF